MRHTKLKTSRHLLRNIWLHKKRTPKQTKLLFKIKKRAIFSLRRKSNFFKIIQARRFLSIFYGNLPCHDKSNRKNSLSNLQQFFHSVETRLDTIVYRMCINLSFYSVKQLISHKKVLVNNQIVDVASYKIRPGDCIRLTPDCVTRVRQALKLSLLAKKAVPRVITKKAIANLRKRPKNPKTILTQAPHLEMNWKTLTAIVLTHPKSVRLPYILDVQYF